MEQQTRARLLEMKQRQSPAASTASEHTSPADKRATAQAATTSNAGTGAAPSKKAAPTGAGKGSSKPTADGKPPIKPAAAGKLFSNDKGLDLHVCYLVLHMDSFLLEVTCFPSVIFLILLLFLFIFPND